MFVCLLDELILGFCYSDLVWETGGFELASTITFVLQANRLTKCNNVITQAHSFTLCSSITVPPFLAFFKRITLCLKDFN